MRSIAFSGADPMVPKTHIHLKVAKLRVRSGILAQRRARLEPGVPREAVSAQTRERLLGLLSRCALALAAAFALFAFLFLRSGRYFWLCLTLSVIVLCALAMLAESGGMRAALGRDRVYSLALTVGVGTLSALALYGIFFVGNLAARRLFPFGAADIEAVYRQGAQTPRWLVALLLLMVVGPGEEFFWRGYVQRRLAAHYGRRAIGLSILAYTGVHVATGNLTLILAAFVCGAFWALLYERYGSIRINMISHGLWAMAIFVLFPMG